MITQEDLHNILASIPELEDNPEGAAIITHTLSHPDILYPGTSESMRKRILKLKGKRERKNIKKAKSEHYKFIDLFAGIGGFRQAFSNLGCDCVFSCEWDSLAKETYFANYHEVPFGDIRTIKTEEIPDHDILCAGFPCQPFSIAGVSKKQSMGLETGFQDKTQGTLFFEICRILEYKRPKVFFLENVKNLMSHDRGRTWEIILETLESDLGYHVSKKVVDGKFWVPQHRERIFIVGFDKRQFFDIEGFDIPSKPLSRYIKKSLNDILEKDVPEKYTLGIGTWNALQKHKKRHSEAGNGFGYSLLPQEILQDTVTNTLSARYYKDGAEILIPQGDAKNPRKLTIREAMQLQGFDPETFVFPVGNVHAYKQLGNSVVVPAIKDTAKSILQFLGEKKL